MRSPSTPQLVRSWTKSTQTMGPPRLLLLRLLLPHPLLPRLLPHPLLRLQLPLLRPLLPPRLLPPIHLPRSLIPTTIPMMRMTPLRRPLLLVLVNPRTLHPAPTRRMTTAHPPVPAPPASPPAPVNPETGDGYGPPPVADPAPNPPPAVPAPVVPVNTDGRSG